jgi:hypothetical protein
VRPSGAKALRFIATCRHATQRVPRSCPVTKPASLEWAVNGGAGG